MRAVRRHLSCVLTVWVIFQIAGICAPVAFAAAGHTTDEELCTCPGSEHGATCPMHHAKGKVPSNRCVMRSASAPGDLALVSFAIGAGSLPEAVTPCTLDLRSTTVASFAADAVSRPQLPDARPPRS